VGGGILALAGVAFAATGPSAILAFALNGVLAFFTAFSFAELATRFPQSGAPYSFVKKVYSVETAFAVGWVVWFASIVAGALYAVGFARFTEVCIVELFQVGGYMPPEWIQTQFFRKTLACVPVLFYTAALIRRTGSGGQMSTIGKTILFAVLILVGLWAMRDVSPGRMAGQLQPFFTNGAVGLFEAMGYTFIALQGFSVIAAVGGEVRNPSRNLPRSMFLSLSIALLIYIPFLFIICIVGVDPGEKIGEASTISPVLIVVLAVQRYMGQWGYWFVMLAGILAMISALHANLMASSRVALAMARDRALPGIFGRTHEARGTPIHSILLSAFLVVIIVLAVPNVAVAGAASSLVFLIAYGLMHWTAFLARKRSGIRPGIFRTPFFPLVPVVGLLGCAALAIFQGVRVPAAGQLIVVWVGLGGILYLLLFAKQARIHDAATEAYHPDIGQLRGKSPLVLVPVANPQTAAPLMEIANAIRMPHVGRVLLVSVIKAPQSFSGESAARQIEDAQKILQSVLTVSFSSAISADALTAVAEDPWEEIARVARRYRCESLLLGYSRLDEKVVSTQLEELVGRIPCDVAVLHAPADWYLSGVKKVLVPVGGRSRHEQLRGRLLGSLLRAGVSNITFLRIVPEQVSEANLRSVTRELRQFLGAEVSGSFEVETVRSNEVVDTILERAEGCDLMLMGLQKHGRDQKVFGPVSLEIVRRAKCGVLFLSGRG
jgi:amino acid transporter